MKMFMMVFLMSRVFLLLSWESLVMEMIVLIWKSSSMGWCLNWLVS